jgi:precorrin-6Y C5,15-methyltransferase (decarboxylating)
VFALTGGVNRASDCCEALTKAGLGEVEVVIGEALTLPHERILKGQAKDFIDAELLDLAVLYVEHSNWISPNKSLKDSDFIRGKVPMTKEEIRHLSIDKLQVEPDEVVYDIGAGTGSVAIELARKAYQGMVYAIERKEEGLELIQENRLKHGAFNLNVIKGLAPAALEGLPAPDKVFIGGSGGQMAEIVEKLLVVNPKLKLVINVVSLQGINEAIKILDGYQTMDYEVICVNVARSRKLGSYDLMMAQNPVYIITMDFAKMKGESEDE